MRTSTSRAASDRSFAVPSHLVGAAALHANRGVVGRHLLDPAPELGQGGLHGSPVGGRSLPRGQLAVEVVGRRAGAEGDHRPVRLVVGQVVLDQPRGTAEEDRQHASRERIERAAVPDASHAGQAPDDGDHVVRGGPGGLVDDEDAVVGPVTEGTATRVMRSRPGAARSAARLGQDERPSHRPSGTAHGRAGGAGMPSAAEAPAEHGGVDAAVARADADPRPVAVLP